MLNSYFNLKPIPDSDIPLWDSLGQIWRETHRAGSRVGIAFAVAFPEWMNEGFSLGGTLRVFTANNDQSNQLCDVIDSILNDVEISRIREVPSDINKLQWEAYRMHRLPGPVSRNRKTVPLDVAIGLLRSARERRIAQQQSLPFVRMRSSSGNLFRLVIERIAADPSQQGQPNGYGLSRASQITALPVL